MQVQAYLNFDGRTEEAIEFYRQALGAEVTALMRYQDNPESCESGMVLPGAKDKILHSSFRVGDTELMASDCQCQGKPLFQGISLTLNPKTEAETDRYFNALAAGGQVQMPPAKTFFSPRFGVVADKFGISWMIVTAP
jgi:PhnB protein